MYNGIDILKQIYVFVEFVDKRGMEIKREKENEKAGDEKSKFNVKYSGD